MRKSLYLKATILSSLNKDESAIATWKKLVSIKSDSKFIVYANIALGDYYFNDDESSKAKKYYLKAKSSNQRMLVIMKKQDSCIE